MRNNLLYFAYDDMDRGQKMRERMILECIQDIADSWYHKTGDKWYLMLGLEATKKLRSKNYETKTI